MVQENKRLRKFIQTEQDCRKSLEEKVMKMEIFSRKDNLIFTGIVEENHENCEARIIQYLSSIGLGKLHPRAIVRAHRLGKFSGENRKPRPIIVKFAHYKDRQITLQNTNKIAEQSGIKVEEDFPEEIKNRCKVLLPVYWAIYHHRDETHPHTWPYRKHLRLQADKLFFNGMVITTDSLHKLPDIFHPRRLFTPSNKNITAFFTNSSPLSNHYRCQVEINCLQYNCVEQYLMEKKATFCGDHHLAQKIMREPDPVRQKSLGKLAEASGNFSQDAWRREALKLMKTGNNILAEANPTDHFWAVGLHLRDKKLWDPQQWQGKNHLGKILMEVRTEIKQQ